MRTRFIATFALACIGLTGPAPAAWAQNVHRDHFLTFDTPVALPGNVMLPAGTYLFTFPSTAAGMGVTEILSRDRLTVFATLMTIPVERAEADQFAVVLVRTSTNAPPTLKAWFCDRSRTGHEFVSSFQR